MRYRIFASAALVAALTGAATANAAPSIASAPSSEAFGRYYPERAMRNGLRGRATLQCHVNEAGRLVDCKVLSEWPAQQGFGYAALSMSKEFRMKDGPGEVTLPIRFQLAPQSDAFEVGPKRWVSWLTQPTEQQVMAAYPGAGQVVQGVGLECKISAEGRLEACGAGPPSIAKPFRDAALSLAPLYSVAKLPADSVSDKVRFWIQLVPPDTAATK